MEYLVEEKNEWLNIRRQLLDIKYNRYQHNNLWTDATSLFFNSVSNKYMKPLADVRQSGDQNGEGYLIVSSLIIVLEVLASFRVGKNYRNPVINRNKEYNDSKNILSDFLKDNNMFRCVFDGIADYTNSNIEDILEDFYYNVRCNLIHGGRLGSEWTISSSRPRINDLKFIKTESNKKVIYRNILFKVINVYITEYIKLLNDPHRENNDIRKKFARRFDWHFSLDYNNW